MSPRIDHRPPIVAFLFLVVLAIAVVGTSARAVDGIVSGDTIGARVETSGVLAASAHPDRERALSRDLVRGAARVKTDKPNHRVRMTSIHSLSFPGRGAHRGWAQHNPHNSRQLMSRVQKFPAHQR